MKVKSCIAISGVSLIILAIAFIFCHDAYHKRILNMTSFEVGKVIDYGDLQHITEVDYKGSLTIPIEDVPNCIEKNRMQPLREAVKKVEYKSQSLISQGMSDRDGSLFVQLGRNSRCKWDIVLDSKTGNLSYMILIQDFNGDL